MKAQRNRSISRWAALLGLLLCAQQMYSQEIYDWEAWRGSRNIAGLDTPSSSPRAAIAGKQASSSAELTGGFASGGFRSASEAQQLWSVGAAAQTEVHLPNLILTGDFSFNLQSGADMMGSMFVHPGYYPIDVLEFTPGRKILQTYGLSGGFAWKNGSRWTPGGTLHFEGSNYAKRKDIRHTTYRQELEVVPSVAFSGDGFTLGASYIFSKTSEFITAEQIGSATAESYYAFLDKGLMYGTYQVWNGSGIHLAEAGVDRLPVKEFSHGFALQAEVGNFLFGELEYIRSHGEIGEKGYTWFRFPGASMAGRLQYTLHRPRAVHVFGARVDWMRQENDETVMEKVTDGGVTTPREYGSNRIFERRNLSGGPFYKYFGKGGLEISAEAVFTKAIDRSTLMYPFLDRDESTVMLVSAEARIPIGHFEIKAGLLGGNKIGEHSDVVSSDNENLGVITEPFRMKEWWDREQEVTDATRFGGTLGLRYNFTIAKRYKLYVSAECTFMHAIGIVLLPGANRQASLLTIGYEF
ncbi:MAG: hypothetical protein IJ795_06910 [Bacteroidales bacterium]|nr:hypothetical protein [Bacteroidales bacterium]